MKCPNPYDKLPKYSFTLSEISFMYRQTCAEIEGKYKDNPTINFNTRKFSTVIHITYCTTI
jgi:hypothetical protein